MLSDQERREWLEERTAIIFEGNGAKDYLDAMKKAVVQYEYTFADPQKKLF